MQWLASKLYDLLQKRVATKRLPNFYVGGKMNPYMKRWHLIKRNSVGGVYLHEFKRSDYDGALHDHPYLFNISFLLKGHYIEHTIKAGGVHKRARYEAGHLKFRGPWSAHRIEIEEPGTWSLFITGPRVRDWYFHCPNGLKLWSDFVKKVEGGNEAGGGCGE
jgi:hypothetical protein